MTFQKTECSSGAIAALFGQRSDDPAARLSPGLQDQVHPRPTTTRSPGTGLPRVVARISQVSLPRSRKNSPSHVPPVASRRPMNLAGMTRALFCARMSRPSRRAGSSVNRWCAVRPLARSRTISRDCSRGSAGRLAISSSGRSKSNSAASTRVAPSASRTGTGGRPDRKRTLESKGQDGSAGNRQIIYCTVLSMCAGLPRDSEPSRKPSSSCRP